jgi:hypothetical protein
MSVIPEAKQQDQLPGIFRRGNLNDSFASLYRDRDSNLAPDKLTGRPMFRLLSADF